MDMKTNLKEKRKKNETPKSSKKRRLSKHENTTEKLDKLENQFGKTSDNRWDILQLAKEIEDEYITVTSDNTPSKSSKKRKLSKDDKKIEKIKEQLLSELEEEKLRIEALNKEVSNKFKLSTVEATCEEDNQTSDDKKSKTVSKSKKDTPKSNKKQKISEDDKVIEDIKQQLLNELEEEKLRVEELNRKLTRKLLKGEVDNELSEDETNKTVDDSETEVENETSKTVKNSGKKLLESKSNKNQKISKDDKFIEKIKQKLLNELEEEKLRVEELNKKLTSKLLTITNSEKKLLESKSNKKQKISKDDKVIENIKQQLLNELEEEKLRVEELNKKLTSKLLKGEIRKNKTEKKDYSKIKVGNKLSEDETSKTVDDSKTEVENEASEDGTSKTVKSSEKKLESKSNKKYKINEVETTDNEKITKDLEIKQQLLKELDEELELESLAQSQGNQNKGFEHKSYNFKEYENVADNKKMNTSVKLHEEKAEKSMTEEQQKQLEIKESEVTGSSNEDLNTQEEMDTETTEQLIKFDAKKFRQSLLNKKTCYGALKEFIELCSNENTTQDFALEYLESGGSTSEIIHVIEIAENKTASFVLPIVEALTIVLVKILSDHPQKQLESEESCREFINKHYSVIKAMIALNSTSKQRKCALKMLTVIVSLSASTAKEVLSHAVFDDAVLELLYQPSNLEDGSSVRTHFIHFLISFLVDGHSAVIIAFLEKRALLTSIFSGLVYDTVDQVNLVLSTIQTRILENKSISKTIKMNLFNTKTIQKIVNLFNWKGPRGWNPKKRKENKFEINVIEKQEVCEIALKFLTCLCASKHGIIFFDPSVGLSSKKYNPLLLTVLNGLGKPWLNNDKKQLVLKICIACPDVFKTVLASVEELLAPRASENWLSVINFVKELIENLTPEAIEQFLVKLHDKQMSLVMQQLCVPHSILTKISDGITQDDIKIRHECVNLLNIMLNSADNYLKFARKTPELNENVVRGLLSAYLKRCLPSGTILLKDWYQSIEAARLDENIDQTQLNVYLTKLLDVLYQYNTFCPGLIENITQNINVKLFLQTIDELSEKDKTSYDLHIKAINLLISYDLTIFAPSKEFFAYALPLLFKFYYHTGSETQIVIEKMIFSLFKLTNIFDCCPDEILIWLYSILDQPFYDEKLMTFLTQVLVKTNNDFLKYSDKMTTLKEQFTEGYNYRFIIENFSQETKNTLKLKTQSKHRILSPFILGFLDLLVEKYIDIKSYLNVSLMNLLHYQTNPTIFVNIVLQEKYDSIVGANLHKYFSHWKLNKKIVTKKDLSPENTIYYKLIHFLTKEEISDMPQLTEYCSKHSKYYTKTIMSNLIMFYYTQKSVTNSLTSAFQTKCYELLLYIINNSEEKHLNYCLKSILDHPLMLDSFSPTFINTESNKLSTEFIVNIIKELLKTKTKSELEIYLGAYQTKLVEQIYKLLENYSENTVVFKTEQLMDIVKLFDLSYDNCSEILNIISKISVPSFKSVETKSLIVLKLQSFILGHESNYLNFKPFSNEILTQINKQMIEFNNSELNLEELELNLFNYIKHYPHANINFNSELFESLLTKPTITKSSVRLATILLQKNHKYLEIFIRHLDEIYEKRELVFALTNAIMNGTDPTIKILLENVYKQYESIIMKYLNKPQKSANYLVENYQVIIKLITEQLKPEFCKEFCAKTHKFDSAEIHHFETLTIIFNKTLVAESAENLKQKYITNYLTTSMNLLINLLKRANKMEEDWTKGEKIAKHFCTYIIKIRNVYKIELKEEKVYSGAVFQTFAKLCLKFGLQEKPTFVNVLRHLCALTPDKSNISDLGVLFEMAISHSESLNILLSDDEKKAPLLSLLLAICKRCKAVMIKSHIPIWLSAYEATLSETDQYLLQLLSMYETANIGFHEFRPYLWGKAAVAHYSVRSSIETTLWRQPKPKEVLDLFNENRIVHTIQHFPWTRRLQNDSLYSDSDIEVYDPAFYLPLLSYLMAPESTIRWYQCTQRGIISLPIIALTSENEGIRAAACNVLARFHGHLEAATYAKQRFLWLHLIEAVCRGTSSLPSLRPCTIVAVFLARCSIVFTRPDHPLYSTLGNYISAKECPNFNIVPELLNMLHSTDVNHTAHRNFILEVIRDGLCTEEDLKVLYKSVAFKLIMDLYNSVLTDYEGKKIILEILASAVTLQNGARTLISSYNIISWLHAVLQQFNKNSTDLLSVFIKIINNLITSFEDDLFKHLQFNILLLLVSVIDTFKTSRLDLMHVVKYIQVLYKVYDKKPNVLTRTQLLNLLSMSSPQLDCKICNYYLDFGAGYVEMPTLLSDDVETVGCYYLKLLTLKWIQVNKK